jgi:hypothetical protein
MTCHGVYILVRLLFMTQLAVAPQTRQFSYQTEGRYQTGSRTNGDGVADLAILNPGKTSSGP